MFSSTIPWGVRHRVVNHLLDWGASFSFTVKEGPGVSVTVEEDVAGAEQFRVWLRDFLVSELVDDDPELAWFRHKDILISFRRSQGCLSEYCFRYDSDELDASMEFDARPRGVRRTRPWQI